MKNKLLYPIVLGTLLLLSIANIVLFVLLLQVKNQVADGAGQAASAVEQMQAQSLTGPFTVQVTIDETFDIPIKVSIPVKTTVTVPIVIPVTGEQVSITVPIDTIVPIDMTAHVPIKKSLPVNIKMSDLPIGGILQNLHDWLTKLASSL
ncbi:MAG: hypothetical protein WC880_01430 [Candidatus Paceibacterota bacterium]